MRIARYWSRWYLALVLICSIGASFSSALAAPTGQDGETVPAVPTFSTEELISQAMDLSTSFEARFSALQRLVQLPLAERVSALKQILLSKDQEIATVAIIELLKNNNDDALNLIQERMPSLTK